MSMKFVAYSLLLSICSLARCQQCSFNKNCSCSGLPLQVNCAWDNPPFPIFDVYNSTPILQITITVTYTGNATLIIPSNAFVGLQSFQNSSNIIFSGNYLKCKFAPKIIISQNALTTYRNIIFHDVLFANLNIPNLSNRIFDNIIINNLLAFYQSCIDSIDDNAFYGLNVYSIELYESVVNSMQPKALAGINFIEAFNSEIQFTSAGLNDIQPFKFSNAYQLWIDFNNITNIGDFSFCTCRSLYACNNTALVNIYLENNNIQYVSDNAFSNLPNLNYIFLTYNSIQTIGFANTVVNTLDLAYNTLIDFSATTSVYVNSLYLSNNQITSVPISDIQSLASSLILIDLSDNNITYIDSNSFYGYTKINNINLNYNPINTIVPGAFNGMISMNTLSLSYIDQLITVDLLIAYGMPNLRTLSFVSVALELVYLSDSAKLPSGLTNIYISQIDTLKRVDSSLESWLLISQKNVYEFSYNKVFPCDDDIQWMAKYAVCIPMQIVVYGTVCQDGTPLISYLQSFKPSC